MVSQGSRLVTGHSRFPESTVGMPTILGKPASAIGKVKAVSKPGQFELVNGKVQLEKLAEHLGTRVTLRGVSFINGDTGVGDERIWLRYREHEIYIGQRNELPERIAEADFSPARLKVS